MPRQLSIALAVVWFTGLVTLVAAGRGDLILFFGALFGVFAWLLGRRYS